MFTLKNSVYSDTLFLRWNFIFPTWLIKKWENATVEMKLPCDFSIACDDHNRTTRSKFCDSSSHWWRHSDNCFCFDFKRHFNSRYCDRIVVVNSIKVCLKFGTRFRNVLFFDTIYWLYYLVIFFNLSIGRL